MRRVNYRNEKGMVGATVIGSETDPTTGKKNLVVQFDGRDTVWRPDPMYFASSCVDPSNLQRDSAEEFGELMDSLGITGAEVTEETESVTEEEETE